MKLLRLVIIFIIEIALALLIMLLRGVSFTMMNLSDHFFVVGVIIGLPSIVAITQAFRLFYGFRYAARVFITPNYRKIYPSFKDFEETKTGGEKNHTFFGEVLIASLLVIFIAGYLSGVVMNGR
jgi:hypothetical protein